VVNSRTLTDSSAGIATAHRDALRFVKPQSLKPALALQRLWPVVDTAVVDLAEENFSTGRSYDNRQEPTAGTAERDENSNGVVLSEKPSERVTSPKHAVSVLLRLAA
jgi:hypothetical protein